MACELEVCAYSLESCVAAKRGGADRVELCAAPYEGGTTPSAATVHLARQLTEGMELYVMIRPRGGDFLYSELEFDQMREEVDYVRTAGADGVVLGLLDRYGRVDTERTAILVKEAYPLQVTFHRAFDMTVDMPQALEDVIGTGCCRILTSGGRNTAPEGEEMLKKLVSLAAGRIEIMAGSGVKAENAARLAAAGVDALHLSAKKQRDSKMIFRHPGISMGGVPGIPEYGIFYSDEETVRTVKEEIRRVGKGER